MQSYQKLQFDLIEKIECDFREGKEPSTIVEPVPDYIHDDRICLTAISFLPQEVEDEIITKIIKPLREADSRQYFYVPSSFHVTIQNVRTIANPPLFNDRDIEKTKDVFERMVPQFNAPQFSLEGIFILPTSLSVCAFTSQEFGSMVKRLRIELEKNGVEDNKKYADENIILANSTFCRFTTDPNEDFMEKVKDLKKVKVGQFTPASLSLVETNCVCLPEKTNVIASYSFRK